MEFSTCNSIQLMDTFVKKKRKEIETIGFCLQKKYPTVFVGTKKY